VLAELGKNAREQKSPKSKEALNESKRKLKGKLSSSRGKGNAKKQLQLVAVYSSAADRSCWRSKLNLRFNSKI